jgi:type II secretory pathway predicted ATPase ExeA
MSAYLKFFELEQSPFEGKAQAQVVLGTRALREAFATIREGLEEGAARICLSGGPGLGKTSLARALPKLLAQDARVAIVLDPSLSWEAVRGSIAKQWGLDRGGLPRAGLIEAARSRRLVLVIDQAEQASEEFLDYLDVILSYRTENDEPVVQSVLLARLAGSESPDPVPLLWWLDRIQTLQLEFAPLPRDGVESYIRKHLKRAGWRGGQLFTPEAALTIHGYTGGIPGEISALCERLLSQAAEAELDQIDDEFVHALFDEDGGEDELVLDHEVQKLSQSLEHFGREQTVSEALDHIAADDPFELDQVVGGVAEVGAVGEVGEVRSFDHSADENVVSSVEEPFDEPFEPEASDFVGSFADGTSNDAAFDEDEADFDDGLISIEDDLSRPASPEELRAILGSVVSRHARAIAMAGAAALVGGLLIAWITSPSEAPQELATPPTASRNAAANPNPAIDVSHDATRADDPVWSENGTSEPILARVRGPVRAPLTAIEAEAAAEPPSSISLGAEADDEDEEFLDDEFIDLRPAELIPNATRPAAPAPRGGF